MISVADGRSDTTRIRMSLFAQVPPLPVPCRRHTLRHVRPLLAVHMHDAGPEIEYGRYVDALQMTVGLPDRTTKPVTVTESRSETTDVFVAAKDPKDESRASTDPPPPPRGNQWPPPRTGSKALSDPSDPPAEGPQWRTATTGAMDPVDERNRFGTLPTDDVATGVVTF
jgi:hypothetical protein